MRLQIIDDMTYAIGDGVFEVGDDISLTDEETAYLEGIKELEVERKGYQQRVIDFCLEEDRNFKPEYAEPADAMTYSTLELSYRQYLLRLTVQRRLGGLLPMEYKKGYEGLVVQPKNPQTEVNYTLGHLKRQIGFQAFEDLVGLAKGLHPEGRSPLFDINHNDEVGIQPVIAKFKFDGKEPVTAVAEAAVPILEKKSAIGAMIILTNNTNAGIFDIKEEQVENYHVFLQDDPRNPTRFNIIKSVAKKLGTQTIIVIQSTAPGPDPAVHERLFSVMSFTKTEEKSTRLSHKLRVSAQPKEITIEKGVGTFDAGEQYESILG